MFLECFNEGKSGYGYIAKNIYIDKNNNYIGNKRWCENGKDSGESG